MKNLPLFSICIPAYKRVNYLERLLKSISQQKFTDFEIVITDDTDDMSIFHLTEKFNHLLPIKYFKNKTALGTPANWNAAIERAHGEWIKLMHDDDWFTSPNSLTILADNVEENKKFIFSAYTNCFELPDNKEEKVFMPFYWRKRILREPNVLLANNVIGPPSVTLFHNSIKLRYDERLKWRVDMEYYVRVLLQEKIYKYINKSLINVGISASQVTQYCFSNPSVELPEAFLVLQIHGIKTLKNIWVYDAWWRLLRNMNIRSDAQLKNYVNKDWPLIIKSIVKDLNIVPETLLKNGYTSKSLMTISYLKNISGIN